MNVLHSRRVYYKYGSIKYFFGVWLLDYLGVFLTLSYCSLMVGALTGGSIWFIFGVVFALMTYLVIWFI
jgi:hypothetical protein